MAKKSFTPQSLKVALLVTLFVIIATVGALFYFGLTSLKSYAIDVNHRLSDANASGEQIDGLQVLKNQLANSQMLIDKANQMVSTQDSYQAQALTDIRAIAKNAGVSVINTEFNNKDQTDEHSVTVSLDSPVSYKGLIRFFEGIESNLPKMQVISATVGHVEGGNADSVTVDEIKIKLTVK